MRLCHLSDHESMLAHVVSDFFAEATSWMPHAQHERPVRVLGGGFTSCFGILRRAGFDSGYMSLFFCEPLFSAFHGQCLRVA